MKIVTVIGNRPHFIKASIVSIALKSDEFFEEIIVHTGQHYDKNMSDIFFEELSVPAPKYHLDVGSLSHANQTAIIMQKIEHVFIQEEPDAVLVYGDTNSTLAAALVAAKLHIPVIHIEAGLRSFNKRMPEEINRILVDHISHLLFCPSPTSANNLLREGIKKEQIFIVGDVMVDATLKFSTLQNEIKALEHDWHQSKFVLCTIHRAENTDDLQRMKNILELIELISDKYTIVFPVHPRTLPILNSYFNKPNPKIKLINPIGYLDMLNLQKQCAYIITDSGGVQKEAYVLKKPCITLRTETEWTETIENNCNLLLPPTYPAETMHSMINTFISNYKHSKMDLYGGGQASRLIVETIKRINQ